jgi:hypothetical protein
MEVVQEILKNQFSQMIKLKTLKQTLIMLSQFFKFKVLKIVMKINTEKKSFQFNLSIKKESKI